MRMMSLIVAGMLGASGTAWAEPRYEIKQMTPAIQQALEGRQARYEALRRLKSLGLVGENTQGLVELRRPDPEAAPLVERENADRTVIYQAIVEQHQLGAGGLEYVQRAFAEVQRDKAQPGDPVQRPSGEWTTR